MRLSFAFPSNPHPRRFLSDRTAASDGGRALAYVLSAGSSAVMTAVCVLRSASAMDADVATAAAARPAGAWKGARREGYSELQERWRQRCGERPRRRKELSSRAGRYMREGRVKLPVRPRPADTTGRDGYGLSSGDTNTPWPRAGAACPPANDRSRVDGRRSVVSEPWLWHAMNGGGSMLVQPRQGTRSSKHPPVAAARVQWW